jgi:DNA-binding MarR family transcriptional regulator
MAVLEAFRELDPDMPIQYALSFLTIARNPGLSIRELSERLGIAQSSASRNVAALSAWHSFRKPGHGLVEANEDPRERRRKIVSLTAKGEALLGRLDAEMAGRTDNGQPVTRFAGEGTGRRQLKASNA